MPKRRPLRLTACRLWHELRQAHPLIWLTAVLIPLFLFLHWLTK